MIFLPRLLRSRQLHRDPVFNKTNVVVISNLVVVEVYYFVEIGMQMHKTNKTFLIDAFGTDSCAIMGLKGNTRAQPLMSSRKVGLIIKTA